MAVEQEDWCLRRVMSEPNGSTENRPAFLITIDTEGDNLWSLRVISRLRMRGFCIVSNHCAPLRVQAHLPHQLRDGDERGIRGGAHDLEARGTAEVGDAPSCLEQPAAHATDPGRLPPRAVPN